MALGSVKEEILVFLPIYSSETPAPPSALSPFPPTLGT